MFTLDFASLSLLLVFSLRLPRSHFQSSLHKYILLNTPCNHKFNHKMYEKVAIDRPMLDKDDFNPDARPHDGPRHNNTSLFNQTDRFELFLLGEGEKKCAEALDTRE
jgi:hypothetical protein